MIGFDAPIFLLLLIPAIGLAVSFWRNGFVNLSPGRARVALAVRIALLALIVLGLAGLTLDLGQSRQAAVIVADLSASDAAQSTQMQQFINTAAARRSGGNRLGVVTVGREATVEQPVSTLSSFDGFQTSIDPDYTNLAGGLLLANAILPSGYEHRITVITDGQQNVGDAISSANLLRALHVRVDVVPVRVQSGPEVMVNSVTMPSQLRPGEQFDLVVNLHSTVRTRAQITVYQDQTLMLSKSYAIPHGSSSFSFRQPPLKPGFHTYTVHVSPVQDTQVQNNVGSAFALVSGRPKVLVISPSYAAAATVMNSLRSTDISPQFEYPANVVPSLAYLERYAATVIVDTPIEALDPQIVQDLVPYVRDLGHGLVVIGGPESFGMGGYGQTGLEEALPVSMNLPKRRDLPSAAVALIIEDLESNSQVNISKVAGKGVVALMTQQDQITVNDACGGQFPVTLQHVVNRSAIDAQIDNMVPCDPMTYTQDLVASANLLKTAHATVKHIILLGDGDAVDPSDQRIAQRIRAEGITISTVATNGMGYSDISTMRNIAQWGGGRFYNANNPNAIPHIFLREAHTFARSGIIPGKFYPQVLSANPMIKDLHVMPYLTGYVATTPKPTGEMVLVSKKLDPVLAGWQFGLGRSVAWTSDASGLWTRNWLAAPTSNKFWSDLVAWTLPSSTGGHLAVTTGASQGDGTVSLTTPSALGPNPTVTARILSPDLKTSSIQLQPTSPGHFQGSFATGASGAYFITAQATSAGHGDVGIAGLDVPYSAEFRTSGSDMPFIRQLAAAGGGAVVSQPSSVWAGNLSSASARQSLNLWLWLLALLLLPVDIGVRRLIVSRRDLDAILHAIPGFGRPVPALVPALAPLGAIRQQRTAGASPFATLRRSPVVRAERSANSSSPSPVRIAKSITSRKPSNSQSVKTPGPGDTPSTTTEPSTTGQLLAARRRRR